MGNYNPNKKEVFSEIKQNFGKQINEFNSYTLVAGLSTSIVLHAFTTYKRVNTELYRHLKRPETSAGECGIAIGIAGGVLANLGLLGGYVYLTINDHPEVLLIPLATNLASIVCDHGRTRYKNARQKLIREREKPSNKSTNQTRVQKREELSDKLDV